MAEIKFGFSQKNNPTPTNVGNLMDLITIIVSFLSVSLTMAPFITSKDTMIINWLSSVIAGLSQILKRFFGVNTSQTNVPIEQVGEMQMPEKIDTSKFPYDPPSPNK